MGKLAYVLSHGDEAVTDAVVRTLEHDGWTVLHDGDEIGDAVDGVVYIPGLLTATEDSSTDPVVALMDLMESLRPNLAEGGARVVAIGSRDWLGWPSRPRVAAKAAALVATVRSLALAYGQAGVTVNGVVATPPDAVARRADGPAPGTHLYEPAPLTGEAVTPDDIAATAAFFLDSRSGYITGQILHCCGGASLLSSLSV
jgi:enoyl-ACP reductase-like protein